MKDKQMENSWKETNQINRERSFKLEHCVVKDLISRSGSNYKLCCLMDERVIEACDSVARQSVDIATDVTRLSVDYKEQDAGNYKEKTGPADTLQVPAADMLSVECQG